MRNFMNELDEVLGSMNTGEVANNWHEAILFLTDPSRDVPLSSSQLQQIINNPSCATLVSVLNQVLLSQQLQNEEEKGMKR